MVSENTKPSVPEVSKGGGGITRLNRPRYYYYYFALDIYVYDCFRNRIESKYIKC